MPQTDKFTRLIQLMMMTTSDMDGEALVALRKANAMLAEQNMNWEELLRAKVKFARQEQTEAHHQRERGARDRTDRTTNQTHERASAEQIDAWFEILLDSVPPASSFREFVEDVYEFWERQGYLTEKQEDAIRRSAERQHAR